MSRDPPHPFHLFIIVVIKLSLPRLPWLSIEIDPGRPPSLDPLRYKLSLLDLGQRWLISQEQMIAPLESAHCVACCDGLVVKDKGPDWVRYEADWS